MPGNEQTRPNLRASLQPSPRTSGISGQGPSLVSSPPATAHCPKDFPSHPTLGLRILTSHPPPPTHGPCPSGLEGLHLEARIIAGPQGHPRDMDGLQSVRRSWWSPSEPSLRRRFGRGRKMSPLVWSFPDQGLGGLPCLLLAEGSAQSEASAQSQRRAEGGGAGGAVPNDVPRAGGALAAQPCTAWCREEPGVSALAAAPSSPSSLGTRPVPVHRAALCYPL